MLGRYIRHHTCVVCGWTFVARAKTNTRCIPCRDKVRAKYSPTCADCGCDIWVHSTRCRPCKLKHVAKTAVGKAVRDRIRCSKRRAVMRGIATEDIDPIAIFVEAGWRCAICGIDTPRHLRGKVVHNAPELDHIFPISRGGLHIKSNVQCLCRKCNSRKGNKLPNEIRPLAPTPNP